jgi:transporter family-2 protein
MRDKQTGSTILLALVAGVALALMIDWNSELARRSSPLFASWTAHGVGTLAAMFLVAGLALRHEAETVPSPQERWPLWAYLGGVPGAFTVLLAAITVNSALGLSGAFALMLLGQMGFAALADHFGPFRLPRRRPQLREAFGFALVLVGSIIIVAARS